MSMMNREQKDVVTDTCESFNSKNPLQERSNNVQPFVTQIQDLMYLITRKRAHLREAKLENHSILEKREQQESRISDIKITMEHAVEKEELGRDTHERLEEEVRVNKEALREMSVQIKKLKEKTQNRSEVMQNTKREKSSLQENSNDLEFMIKEKKKENEEMDRKIQNLEMLLAGKQNTIRSKQDEIAQRMSQAAELNTLVGFLGEKIKVAMKDKHDVACEQKEIQKQKTKCEQKIANIRKEIVEMNWNNQQGQAQNLQIEDLNYRLKNDLEGVQKHLVTMKKTNTMLQSALEEYGMTGEQVTKLINSVRTH